MIGASIQASLMMLAIMLLGVLLCRLKWIIPDKHASLLSMLAIQVGTPGLIVYTMFSSFTAQMLEQGLVYILIGIAFHGIMYLVWYLLAPALKVPYVRRGVFAGLCAVPNAIMLATPIVLSMWGDAGVSKLLFMFLPSLIACYTVGVWGAVRDGGAIKVAGVPVTQALALTAKQLSSGARVPIGGLFKSMLNAPFVTIILATALVALNVTGMPGLVLDISNRLAGLVTPAAALFIGSIMASSSLKGLKVDFALMGVAAARFLMSPVLMYLLCMAFGLHVTDPTGTLVFVIAAAMPPAVIISTAAQQEGADYVYACQCNALTTVLSLVFIPVYVLILS